MKLKKREIIGVDYARGKAKVSIPQKGRRKPVIIEVTKHQAEALRDALEFTGLWDGNGFSHRPWPVEEKKRKVKQKQ